MTLASDEPRIAGFEAGHLSVAGGHLIYWEVSGHPDGKPALFLHGGPGSPARSGGYRRLFDPARYRLVSIDQRGCGRSSPLVVEALERLHENTTPALIGDLEAVREHLGISRWLVAGTSWGTTLALAYAQAHPEIVTALVLGAVTTTSRAEVDWITEEIGRVFPDAWHRFAAASGRREGERIVEAYARRLAGDDPEDRAQATAAWCAWENIHVSLSPGFKPLDFPDPVSAAVFATLVTHYWVNDAFLSGEARILDRMDRIQDIPGVLIHGRRDISSPSMTPWRLHRLWPASWLHIVETEGHGGPEMSAEMRRALDAFASGR
ncbi:proline iminopeptidase [Methylobacterium phyllostachyos]|uniref:Proline iminopeptidase n=1 Tax=Methylobacterium phyllostachyos TaxID=582672 RepID=A0A1H0BPB8_9HYPH|nr:prolyl aminopeptidase [Methylobacterium phyllostachyos]SDN47497.1 proline iminopeptidase [Methylobacterium phyllostachyos]